MDHVLKSQIEINLKFSIGVVLIVSAIFINPIYLVAVEFLGLNLEKRIKFVFDILILISVSLMYANRLYGVTWGGDGVDDAPVYIGHYLEFAKHGFLYFTEINVITLNVEIIWYFFAFVCSYILGGNVFLFSFFCVFIPLLLFYMSIRILAGPKAIVLLVTMLLLQNHFVHMIFHIWRVSLATALFSVGFARLQRESFGYKYIVLAIFTHLSLFYNGILLAVSRMCNKKLCYIKYIAAILLPFIIVQVAIFFSQMFDLGDRSSYVVAELNSYNFQPIFIFYIALTALLVKSMPTTATLFATSLIMTFFFTMVFPEYGVIISRLIEIAVPLLFVTLCSSRLLVFSKILLPIYFFSILYSVNTYLSGSSVMNYISFGRFFDMYSGFIGILINA